MKKFLHNNRLLLILYPDIRILDISINNRIYLNALSLTASLPNKCIDTGKNYWETSKIILIDSEDNYIIIMKNIIISKTNNVINILEDKEKNIFYYIVTKLSNKNFKEIKYFLGVADN